MLDLYFDLITFIAEKADSHTQVIPNVLKSFPFCYWIRKWFSPPDSALLWEPQTLHLSSGRTESSLQGGL